MVVFIRLSKILIATHVYTCLIQTSLNLYELEPAHNRICLESKLNSGIKQEFSRLAFSLTRTTLEVGPINTKAKNIDDDASDGNEANNVYDDDPNNDDDANNDNEANPADIIIVVIGFVDVVVIGVIGISVVGFVVIIGSIIDQCF